jgi:uncharacterized membrane protein YkvA (DUF1232 family)
VIILKNLYITCQTKGSYTDTPWKVLSVKIAAVIYFASPIDLIPDFIPVVGYLDDAAVIKLALSFQKMI